MAGKRKPITRKDIVEVALSIIDKDGLEDFKISSVAKAMSVRLPSLYYYFEDRSELLAEVALKIFLDSEADVSSPRGTDWKTWAIKTSLAVRRSLLKHPNAVPLLLQYPPRTMVLGGYERTIRYLERCRVPAEQHFIILAGLDSMIWGSTLFEAAAISRGISSFRLLDPASFAGLVNSSPFDRDIDEKMYTIVLRTFLDGLPKVEEKTASVASSASKVM
jgi:AcrR family transcriptional regulator